MYCTQRGIAIFLLIALVVPPLPVFGEVALPTASVTSETSAPPNSEPPATAAVDVVGPFARMIFESLAEESTAPVESETPPPAEAAPTEEQPQGEEEPPPEAMSSMSSGDPAGTGELNVATNLFKLEPDSIGGGLSYEFPLQVPKGRGGMTPDLRLQYNSQQGEDVGFLGYGWSINIPYIEHINRKGVDQLYTGDDFFYSSLDGEIASTSVATMYGAKVENGDFRKYEYRSGNTWVITDKNGLTYKFGTSTASQVYSSATSTQIFRWMLEEIRDPNNNYVKFEYYKDSSQAYPSRIVYTGSGSTDGIFEVAFIREARSDIATSTRSGFTVVDKYRINEIQVISNGAWVHKYALGYTTGDNNSRSLLRTITESGLDEASTTIALPANYFTYQASSTGWTASSTWDRPVNWNAARLADINGDGLVDIVQKYLTGTPGDKVYINNGTGWTDTAGWTIPVAFDTTNAVQLADINGDGYADIIKANQSDGQKYVYLNNATTTGWTLQATSTWAFPEFLSTGTSTDLGTRIADMNGDGLPDVLRSKDGSPPIDRVHLNTGSGWATSTWTVPTAIAFGGSDISTGSLLIDVNGDQMADIVEHWGSPYTYINTGYGWKLDAQWAAPEELTNNGNDKGTRFVDVNADGLPDVVRADAQASKNVIYINSGHGWTLDTGWTLPVNILDGSGADTGVRFADVDGDGFTDIVGTTTRLSNTRQADVLSKVVNDKGGQVNVTYKATPKYKNGTTNANPGLSVVLQTVNQVVLSPLVGVSATSTYSYDGGFYYYNGPFDRKIAGFATTTKTDSAGQVQKTFYHQGTSTNSTIGEFQDHISKIGRPYRIEQQDSSGSVLAITINKWDRADLGYGRNFVKLVQGINFELNGDTTHRDTAQTKVYDDATGNVTEIADWGEVTGADAGTFTDTGTDRASTTITYAASSTGYLYAPSQKTTFNQSVATTSSSKFTYDGAALGSVTKGNLTKQENWATTTTYASTTKAYNSYGLVTEERDPRYNATTYQYDSFNLYPATSTNALSQITGYLYDYSAGKVKQVLDPNTRVFQTVYDALDRIKEEKQPDLTTPSTLVVKNSYTYTNSTSTPTSVRKMSNLNNATSTDLYTYIDGFGRVLQTRKLAEDGNYAVQDSVYDNRGLLASSSLPYFGTGASSTSATSTSVLYTGYIYDALNRPTTVASVVATTTNSYDDWHTIVTDPRGKRKDFYKDAYGNLSQVVEHVSGTHGTTTYAYDLNKQLTTITDAANNVRNFTYDGLGRRLTSEDLHVSGDGAYGTSTYAYDAANNLTQQVDPKLQTVNFTYDALNRPLTEDYTGSAGTEVTYVYDTCGDGVGRLCGATTTDASTNYAYSYLGQTSREAKTIDNTTYQTLFDYDRLGNIASTTYPDGSQVFNTYNTVGLLEKIDRRALGGSVTNVLADYDYGPNEKFTYQEMANGVKTRKTYDPNALYRLTNIYTYLNTASSTGTGIGASTTLSSNLVSYWELDESSGVANDATPSNNDLTNNNATPFVTAKLNNGADFERGSSQFFSITDAAQTGLDITGDISFSVWVKFETIEASTIIAKFGDNGAPGDAAYRLIAGDGGLHLSVTNSAGTTAYGSWPSLGLSTGTWYHLVATWKASTSKANLYINDAAQAEKTTTGVTDIRNTTNNFNLGISNYPADANYMDGVLDEVGIWNRVLTQGDVNGLYNSGSGLEYGLGIELGTTTIQNLSYTYDANSNITNITNSASSTATTTIDYAYDDINRLTAATSTDGLTGVPTGGIAASSTLSSGLISYWAFDESSGTAADSTGNGKTLTNVNTTPFVAAKINNGADFEFNNSQNFTRTNGTYYDGTSGTVNCWIKPETIDVTPGNITLFSLMTNVGAGGWEFELKPHNSDRLGGWFGAGNNAVEGATTLSPGTMYMATFTWNTSRKEIFLNATSDGANETDETMTAGATNLTVGRYTNTDTLHYDGIMDECGIWNRVLTQGEINGLYASGSGLEYSSSTSGVTYWTQTYTYDILGNLLTKSDVGTYTYANTGYANPHAATSINGVTYAYDNSGNVTSAGSKLFSWNYRDRLTQVATGTATTTYAYDNQNQRVRQTVLGVGTTTYAGKWFDRSATSTQATTTAYVFVGDTLVATIVGNGIATSTYYVHPDHLGSTNIVTNSASGTAVQTFEYYPYGSERTNSSSGGADVLRGFIGQYTDDVAALSYLNARYYDAAKGRFTSQDPVFKAVGSPDAEKIANKKLQEILSDPQLLNSYNYARNNPIIYSDPAGEIAFVPLLLIIYGVYSAANTTVNVLDLATVYGYPEQFTQQEKTNAIGQVILGVAFGGVARAIPNPVKRVGFESLTAYMDATDQFWPEQAYKNVAKSARNVQPILGSRSAQAVTQSSSGSANSGNVFQTNPLPAYANSTQPTISNSNSGSQSTQATLANISKILANISFIISTWGTSSGKK